MTVMPTNTREFNIGQILVLSAKLAGIMPMEQAAEGPQWDQRANFGRDQLKLILDGLPRNGAIARNIELYTLTLTATIGTYAFPADTVDILGDAEYSASGQTARIFVRQIDREAWLRYPDPTSQNVPNLMYVQRHATVSALLLPVPQETGATLVVQRQFLLADTTDLNATPDLERYWIDYIQHELAARYAFASSMRDKAGDLRKLASDFKAEAENKANQGIDNQMVLSHQTGWSGR